MLEELALWAVNLPIYEVPNCAHLWDKKTYDFSIQKLETYDMESRGVGYEFVSWNRWVKAQLDPLFKGWMTSINSSHNLGLCYGKVATTTPMLSPPHSLTSKSQPCLTLYWFSTLFWVLYWYSYLCTQTKNTHPKWAPSSSLSPSLFLSLCVCVHTSWVDLSWIDSRCGERG